MNTNCPWTRWTLVLAALLAAASGLGGAARAAEAAPAPPAAAPRPWDMTALEAAPKWAALERPKAAGLRAISYASLPFRGQPTRVFAWLGLPALKPGEKAPAMVLIHGGGGTAFEEWVRLWVERGYAAIAMDNCGQVPVGNYGHWYRDDQGGPPGWGGFDQLSWPREDQWSYHAVADAVLAHSLIRSLPEVDPERTGVTGISWGGYLTCIVAGIDHRFKLAVPVYGCGFYRDTVFEDVISKLRPEEADRWMAWWDPSVYLGGADLPMLWVTGSNDFAYTLRALQRSYRLAPGPRRLCVRLRMPHAHGGPGENPKEIRVFADGILKGGAPLPAITAAGRDGATVWAAYSSKVTVIRAELNFTKDLGRWQDRKWESIPAQRAEGHVTAQLPEGTRVYYFNLVDERDCVVSTEHEDLAAPAAPAPESGTPGGASLPAGEGRTFGGIEFVWIPAGTFQMGSSASPEAMARLVGGEARFYGIEHPQHPVTLTKGFWLGRYPVLNQQWEPFIKATGYRTDAEREGWGLGYDRKIGHSNKVNGLTWREPGYPIQPRQPVVMVSWHDAQAFVRWRSEQGAGTYRLPTEAEWEYACRAGTTTAFSFGDDPSRIDDYAWVGANSGYTTQVAGLKKPNPWGLYDMHGNVWDWCQDWLGDYPKGAVVDPAGAGSGEIRIIRGGSWHSPPAYCRSAMRRYYSPDSRNISLGFRLVREQ